jgi:hypothetical protein
MRYAGTDSASLVAGNIRGDECFSHALFYDDSVTTTTTLGIVRASAVLPPYRYPTP